MKNFRNVLPIVVLVLSAMAASAQSYKLVWEDNFDGKTIDSTKWNIEQQIGIWNTGDNRELQHYKKENVSVGDDGNGNNCLILTAKKEDHNGYAFTSGKVTTKGKFAFRKGKLEALIKVPDLANGLWPAFWTLGYTPEGWPNCGEIDILEMGHTHAINEGIVNSFIGAHLFWGPYDGGFPNYGTEYTASEDLSKGYFKHTVEWDNEKIAVYFNDAAEPYFVMGITGDNLNEFHDFQHYILFNLAVGGSFTNIFDANGVTAPIPANMYVDWVKVYQLEGSEDFESNLALFGDFGVYEDESSAEMRMDLGYDLFEANTNLNSRTEDNPYEGANVLSYSINSGNNYELKLTAGQTRNFTNYTNGSLQFYIKTNIQTDIQIGLADNTGAQKFVSFNADNENNFSRDGSWQLTYIELADFAAEVDLAKLTDMLIIKGTANADAYLSIDRIMYKETVPAKGYYFIHSDNTNITDGFVIDNTTGNLYPWENTVGFNEYYPAYEGENVLSFKSQGGAGWFGFGLHSSTPLNFSAFANGYLNISMRTESTESFSIGMESNGTISEVTFNGSNDPYGFERDGTWYHLNIPMSDFSGLNLSEVLIVFLTRGGSIGNIAFDNIYLSEEMPFIDNPMICYANGVTVKPSGKTIEVGEEQTFVADVINQFGNKHDSDPTWSADGGVISEDGVFSANAVGEYTITAVQEGAEGHATITVEEGTDVSDASLQTVYAYILNNTVVINGISSVADIKFYNTSGQLLKQTTSSTNTTFDLSAYASGVYLVSVKTNNQTNVLKVVK